MALSAPQYRDIDTEIRSPLHSTLCFNHCLLHNSIVFRHLTGTFSYQLTTRCHTLQIILNHLHVEVLSVKQFVNFLYIPLCTTIPEPYNEYPPIQKSRLCLYLIGIVRPTAQYRFYLHREHSTVVLPRLQHIYGLYIEHGGCLTSPIAFRHVKIPAYIIIGFTDELLEYKLRGGVQTNIITDAGCTLRGGDKRFEDKQESPGIDVACPLLAYWISILKYYTWPEPRNGMVVLWLYTFSKSKERVKIS